MSKVLKNGRSKLFSCNGTVLRRIILDRGFNVSDLSRMLAFNGSYLSKCCRTNQIGEKCVKMLAENYNIQPSQYECCLMENKKSPAPTINDATEPFELDPNKTVQEAGVIEVRFSLDITKLKEIIKQAVKEGYAEL